MTCIHVPTAGLLALDPETLRAVLRRQGGRPSGRHEGPAAAVEAGVIVEDELDPHVRPLVATLAGSGPRVRVLSRDRGRLTVTDAVMTTAGPGGDGRDGTDIAVLVLRPPGSPLLYLGSLTRGGLVRHLARTVGLGAHVAADPTVDQPVGLREWATVLAAFSSPAPSGWVSRRRRAELHEVRWAPSARAAARTALVVARLDGGLAEVRPSADHAGGFTVEAGDPLAMWSRLSALTGAEVARAGPPSG